MVVTTCRYLLDTCIMIDLLRNRKSTLSMVEAYGIENCAVSEITAAELFVGAEKSIRNNACHEVEELLTFFDVIPVTNAIREYARQRAMLEKQGNKIDDFDLLIGATAVVNDMIMVTDNIKHFERIRGIRLN